jgi:hypothetical protein
MQNKPVLRKFWVAILLLLFSCQETGKGHPAVSPVIDTVHIARKISLQTPHLPYSRIDSIDLAAVLEKKLPLWLSFAKKCDPSFDVRAFTKLPSVGFSPELENPDSEVVDRDWLKYLYIPSPDSKIMLDIYSYRYLMTKDSKGELHIGGADPESTIETLDTQKHIRKRIHMAGSQDGFDDACWITKDIFLVTGSEYMSDTAWQFTYYLYDLERQRTVFGTWPVHPNSCGENYLQKWKGKKWNVKWD